MYVGNGTGNFHVVINTTRKTVPFLTLLEHAGVPPFTYFGVDTVSQG